MFHKPWIAGADLQAQTVQIKIAVTTNQNIQNEAPESWKIQLAGTAIILRCGRQQLFHGAGIAGGCFQFLANLAVRHQT